MIISPLTQEIYLTENKQPRTHKIDTITIHHNGTVGSSLASMGAWFANPDHQCSANYGIDAMGRIACFVPEDEQAWTSNSRENDNRAVTIECANITGEPEWKVSYQTISALVELLADICTRNGIDALRWKNDPALVGNVAEQNMTVHRWFAATGCPEKYLMGNMKNIADMVNEILPPKIYRVQVGAFLSKTFAENLREKLKSEGYSAFVV